MYRTKTAFSSTHHVWLFCVGIALSGAACGTSTGDGSKVDAKSGTSQGQNRDANVTGQAADMGAGMAPRIDTNVAMIPSDGAGSTNTGDGAVVVTVDAARDVAPAADTARGDAGGDGAVDRQVVIAPPIVVTMDAPRDLSTNPGNNTSPDTRTPNNMSPDTAAAAIDAPSIVDADRVLTDATPSDALATMIPCATASDCNDNNLCSIDTCVSGFCVRNAAPQTTSCRPARGDCDRPEYCDGATMACPNDQRRSAADVCRPVAGICDVAENCTGNTDFCPGDSFEPPTTVCRAAVGASAGASTTCDIEELCTGTGAACPANAFKNNTVSCRAKSNTCDIGETCNGTDDQCAPDAVETILVRCQTASLAADTCDRDDFCPGPNGEGVGAGDKVCTDTFRPLNASCRPAAGSCDTAEVCTGASNTCPTDVLIGAGTICNASLGACDPAETCTGSTPACPANVLTGAGTICNASQGVCDPAETCTGSAPACPANVFLSANTTCRPSVGGCDPAEFCTGGTAACPADTGAMCGSVCGTAIESPNNNTVVLTCPAGQVMAATTFASYGTPTGTCGNNDFALGGCNSGTSVTVVNALCQGNNTCTVGANNTVFGDPCPNTPKSLYIRTNCVVAP